MQADINIIGDFLSSGSFSMLSRTIASTLSLEFGLNVKYINKPLSKITLQKESYFSQQLNLSNTLEPSIITLHITNPPFQPIKNSLNVLLNIHNTVDYNKQMLEAHNHFQYVFLNSFKQCEDLNKKNSYQKYIHMPYMVDSNLSSNLDDSIPIINVNSSIFLERKDKPYIFYAEGCFHTRNNFESVIRGYCDAFTSNDNVVLVLKVLNTERNHDDNNFTKNQITEIKNKIKRKDLPKIVLINDSLSDSEYFQLFNSIDCFVAISKWDGLFSGIYHAISLNKEIISPSYNGYCDAINESTAFILDCNKENQYNSLDRFYEPGDSWFETSAREYKVGFIKVYDIFLKGSEGFKKKRKEREKLIKTFESTYLCENMLQFYLAVLEQHHKGNNVFKSISQKIEARKDRNKRFAIK